MDYTPPTAQDLQRLKNELGFSGRQMAELACVGERHWRKYTGGAEPRSLEYSNLFHMAALLVLSPDDVARVRAKMREIGADLDAAP